MAVNVKKGKSGKSVTKAPTHPHSIFDLLEDADIGSIQLRNANNEKIEEFLPGVPMAFIRERTALQHGPGPYSLNAFDAKRYQMPTRVDFTIKEGEDVAAKGQAHSDYDGKIIESFAFTNQQLQAFRVQLDVREAKLDERESTLREKLDEMEKSYQERERELQSELDDDRQAVSAERARMMDGLFEKHEGVVGSAQERAREIERHAETRAGEIETRAEERAERMLDEATVESQRILDAARDIEEDTRERLGEVKDAQKIIELKERTLIADSMTAQSRLDREKLEYKMDMDKQAMLAEMQRAMAESQAATQVELAKIQAKSQASNFSPTVMNEYARAMIRKQYPEESEVEKFFRQVGPFIAPLMGGEAPEGQPVAPEDGMVFGAPEEMPPGLDGMPAFPELPELPEMIEAPTPEQQMEAMPPLGTNPFADPPPPPGTEQNEETLAVDTSVFLIGAPQEPAPLPTYDHEMIEVSSADNAPLAFDGPDGVKYEYLPETDDELEDSDAYDDEDEPVDEQE